MRFILLTLILFLYALPTVAQTDETARGLALAKEHCARCHAIGKTGESQFEKAPPFRGFKKLWPVEALEEALAEGIVTGHPDMPEFKFEPEDVGAFIAYLKTL